LRDRVLCQRLGIVRQAVHAERIERLVDEPGALAVELMRQPTGADDQHLLVLRLTHERAPDRAAELQTARHRREGCCTALIEIGTIRTGQLKSGHISDSGIVTA
jgi:hypothetical protein